MHCNNSSSKPNRILKISAVPTGTPIELLTLPKIKEWCIVDHDQDDEVLNTIYKAVKSAIINRIKQLLSPHIVTVVAEINERQFYLPRLPFIADPVAVELWENNVWDVLVAGTDYLSDAGIYDAIIIYKYGRLRITYTAGYTEGNTPPDDIKLAALNEIAYRYENRGDTVQIKGLTETAVQYLTPYINTRYWL